MDIVLTKEDLAGITVTQTGVCTLTKGGWDVRETTNTSELTPEQTARIIAAKAVESGVASEIELNQYPMNYIAPGIASALRKRVDGKTPHQINEELNKLWETKTNEGN